MRIFQTALFAVLFFFGCTVARAGYTHYFNWRQKPDAAALEQCITEMQRVVEARKSILAGPEGKGAVEVRPTQIELNGLGYDTWEPFIFPGEASDNFCKTEGKPYDEVVTACLLIARDHFPPAILEIASDGSWDEGDWQAGAKLYASTTGRPASNPMSEPEDVPTKRATGWAKGAAGLIVAAAVLWLLKRRKAT